MSNCEMAYTVGELREKLAKYPDETPVHVDADGVRVPAMVKDDGDTVVL
jgi:hypothetical protein